VAFGRSRPNRRNDCLPNDASALPPGLEVERGGSTVEWIANKVVIAKEGIAIDLSVTIPALMNSTLALRAAPFADANGALGDCFRCAQTRKVGSLCSR